MAQLIPTFPSPDFLRQGVTQTCNYDHDTSSATNQTDDKDWAAMAAGSGDCNDTSSNIYIENKFDEIDNFQDDFIDEVSNFCLESCDSNIGSAYRKKINSAYDEATKNSQQADKNIREIQTMLDGLKARRNNPNTASDREKNNENSTLDKQINYATQRLSDARAKKKKIDDQVIALKNLKGMLDALDKLKKAFDKSLADSANAENAANGAGTPGGTLGAAQQRDDDANKAEVDAQAQVNTAQNALDSAQDAVNNLPISATPTQKQVLADLLSEAKKRFQAAQDNLDDIKKYHAETSDALKTAMADDAQKTKDQTAAYQKQIQNLINQISDTTKAASQQNVRDMLTSSQYAAQQMGVTGQGTIAQAQQSLASEKMTVQQQLAELAQRSAATGYTNLLSQMSYLEAIREKAFNLLADLEKNRADNAFTRAKAAVQMSKY